MKKIYWIIIDGVQQGPFTLDEVKARGDLRSSTPVWREGMPDWGVAEELPELWDEEPQSCYAPQEPVYGGQTLRNAGRVMHSDEKPPRNYLVWAIIATICCCVLTGIVAIVYASKVNPAVQTGDMAAAREASDKAALWCVISFVAGLVWTPFYMLYSLVTM